MELLVPTTPMKTVSTRAITDEERATICAFLTPSTESRLSVIVFGLVVSGIPWVILCGTILTFLTERAHQVFVVVFFGALIGFAVTFLTVSVCTFRKNAASLRRQLKAHESIEADLRNGTIRATRYRPEMIYRIVGHDEQGPTYCCRLGESEGIVITSSFHDENNAQRVEHESGTKEQACEFLPSMEFEIADLPGSGWVVSEMMIGPPASQIGSIRWSKGRPVPGPSAVFTFDWKQAQTIEP
jgi:hypothetical protein